MDLLDLQDREVHLEREVSLDKQDHLEPLVRGVRQDLKVLLV